MDPTKSINTMAIAFSCIFVILFCGVACSLTFLVRIYLQFDGIGGEPTGRIRSFLRSHNRGRQQNNESSLNRQEADEEQDRELEERLEQGVLRIDGLGLEPESPATGNFF